MIAELETGSRRTTKRKKIRKAKSRYPAQTTSPAFAVGDIVSTPLVCQEIGIVEWVHGTDIIVRPFDMEDEVEGGTKGYCIPSSARSTVLLVSFATAKALASRHSLEGFSESPLSMHLVGLTSRLNSLQSELKLLLGRFGRCNDGEIEDARQAISVLASQLAGHCGDCLENDDLHIDELKDAIAKEDAILKRYGLTSRMEDEASAAA